MAKSIPEGTLFEIPTRNCGVALGVVARRKPRGSIVAAYIFAAGSAPSWPQTLPGPQDAVFRGKFSDYALRDGSWPTLGVSQSFIRSEWRFGQLLHNDYFNNASVILEVSDQDPTLIIGQGEAIGDVKHLPTDNLNDPVIFARRDLPDLLE